MTPYTFHPYGPSGLVIKHDADFQGPGLTKGGKTRAALAILSAAKARGETSVHVATARNSFQMVAVADVGRALGLKVCCHIPTGPETEEIARAVSCGANIYRHTPGHATVVNARCRNAALDDNGYMVPAGLADAVSLDLIANEVAALPFTAFGRVVVPVGSGTHLAGVLRGFRAVRQRLDPEHPVRAIKILGVVVGGNPEKHLDQHAPGWRAECELVRSPLAYNTPSPVTSCFGCLMDPYYEGKALPYLQPGDLLWNIATR